MIENIGLRGNLGKLIAAGVINIEDLVEGNIDPTIAAHLNLGNVELGGVKTPEQSGIFAAGNIGPVNVGANYQDFGDLGTSTNIGADFNKGNFNIGANYDFENNPNVGFSYDNPEKGVRGGVNYNFEGKPEGQIEFFKTFKKGGRIGFVDGGWADDLTGQGLALYNSMTAGGHSDQTIQDTLTELGYWPIPAATGIETIGVGDEQRGGDGGYQGGGKWGNLDLSKTKTFNKNVFKTEGPVKGWDMSEIEGFYNPQLGQWQTFEGKNIEHAGILTGEPKEGDIEGTPIDWSGIPMGAWGLGMKAFKGIQNAWQNKQAKGILEAASKRQAKAIELHEAKVAADAKAALEASYTGPTTKSWDPVQHEKSGGGHYKGAGTQAEGSAASGPQGGPAYGPWKADGGLATMFERRR